MSAQILDGKLVRDCLLSQLKQSIDAAISIGKKAPGLAVILVGEDPASNVYVGSKTRTCEAIGIRSFSHQLPAETTEKALLKLIDELNENDDVHGILVQLPLPEHINSDQVIERIKYTKDVDGFLPANIGALAIDRSVLSPCTPKGVMTLLNHYKIDLVGKEAVVVGASRIVGRPMALELVNARATVSICRSSTRDLRGHVARSDIVIAAAGVPEMVKGDWIKEGAVVIDVGIHRRADGKLCGDVEFSVAKDRASWISPVPGGVGPMTIATLMENTVKAAGL